MSRRDWLLFGNLVIVAALLAWLTNTDAVLQGDAYVYLDRIEVILGGSLPYHEALFEHLPLSLLPLLGAAALDSLPGVSFALGLAAVNAALLAGVCWFCGRIAMLTGEATAPRRWLLMAGPLLPIVLFRLDPLSLLLAAIALEALLRNKPLATGLAALAGIAARGWPIVFVPEEWRRGWRGIAAGTVAATGAMTFLLLGAPGFSDGRVFDGVQIETVVGSVLLLGRHATGADLAIHEAAGSLYVGWGALPAVLNAIVGATVMAVAAVRLRRRPPTVAALALTVYALLLVSPLLSAQLLVWPTLFVALLASAPHRWIVVTGLMTTALLVWWQPATWWWASLAVGRNALLVATPLVLAGRVALLDPQPRISRRNLPV